MVENRASEESPLSFAEQRRVVEKFMKMTAKDLRELPNDQSSAALMDIFQRCCYDILYESNIPAALHNAILEAGMPVSEIYGNPAEMAKLLDDLPPNLDAFSRMHEKWKQRSHIKEEDYPEITDWWKKYLEITEHESIIRLPDNTKAVITEAETIEENKMLIEIYTDTMKVLKIRWNTTENRPCSTEGCWVGEEDSILKTKGLARIIDPETKEVITYVQINEQGEIKKTSEGFWIGTQRMDGGTWIIDPETRKEFVCIQLNEQGEIRKTPEGFWIGSVDDAYGTTGIVHPETHKIIADAQLNEQGEIKKTSEGFWIGTMFRGGAAGIIHHPKTHESVAYVQLNEQGEIRKTPEGFWLGGKHDDGTTEIFDPDNLPNVKHVQLDDQGKVKTTLEGFWMGTPGDNGTTWIMDPKTYEGIEYVQIDEQGAIKTTREGFWIGERGPKDVITIIDPKSYKTRDVILRKNGSIAKIRTFLINL